MADQNIAKIESLINEVTKYTNEHSRRIRNMEERIQALETRTQFFEDSMIKLKDKLNEGIEEFKKSDSEVNKRLLKLESEMKKVNKGLNRTAKLRDLEEIRSTIDLFTSITTKQKELE